MERVGLKGCFLIVDNGHLSHFKFLHSNLGEKRIIDYTTNLAEWVLCSGFPKGAIIR